MNLLKFNQPRSTCPTCHAVFDPSSETRIEHTFRPPGLPPITMTLGGQVCAPCTQSRGHAFAYPSRRQWEDDRAQRDARAASYRRGRWLTGECWTAMMQRHQLSPTRFGELVGVSANMVQQWADETSFPSREASILGGLIFAHPGLVFFLQDLAAQHRSHPEHCSESAPNFPHSVFSGFDHNH